MSYTNPRHEGRLTLIQHLRDAFASMYVHGAPPGSAKLELEGINLTFFQLDEVGGGNDRDLFNFPFLFHADGNPWHEANDYLLSIMSNKAPIKRRTDDVRRRASKLLDYLLFCPEFIE